MALQQIAFEVAAADLEPVEALLEGFGALAVTSQSEDGSVLLEPGVGEHPLWERVRVTALLPEQTDPEPIRRQIDATLGDRVTGWQVEELEDRAWEREWLEHFRPMRFGQRLWVVPSEMEPPLPEDAVAVRVDPGLAFGTGTHETTALCLEWLDQESLAGQYGVDYGAGSGLLAVAAVRLGARGCMAVDNDPQAVRATQENAERNGVAGAVAAHPAADHPPCCADFLVANILSATLVALADELLALVREGGRIALSGILDGQQERVMAAFQGRVVWDPVAHRGDWVRISGTCTA